LNLTQRAFSETYGFDLNSVKSWESGRRQPDRANGLLLGLIAQHPIEMKRYVAECGVAANAHLDTEHAAELA